MDIRIIIEQNLSPPAETENTENVGLSSESHKTPIASSESQSDSTTGPALEISPLSVAEFGQAALVPVDQENPSGLSPDPNAPLSDGNTITEAPKAMNRIYFNQEGGAEVVMAENPAAETPPVAADYSLGSGIMPLAEAFPGSVSNQGDPAQLGEAEVRRIQNVSSPTQASDVGNAIAVPDAISLENTIVIPGDVKTSTSATEFHTPEQSTGKGYDLNNVSSGEPVLSPLINVPTMEADLARIPGIPVSSGESLTENINELPVSAREISTLPFSQDLQNTHELSSGETDEDGHQQGGGTEAAITAEQDALDQAKLADTKQQKGRFFRDLENQTSLFRHLSVFASLIMGVFLLGITMFIGGSLEDAPAQPGNGLHSTGNNRISLMTGEKFFVKGVFPLFGSERIESLGSDTEIVFAEGSVVRLKKDAIVTIDQLTPLPVIRLETGEIWVMGNRNLTILFDKARFEARSVSARFQKEEGKVTASSFRHPLFVELWAKNEDKHVFFAIPKEKRVIFFENSIPQTIADLHFSKLKKEIRFSDAEKDDWVTTNLIEDNAIISKKIEELRLKKKNHYLGENMLAAIQQSMILFPEKKGKEINSRLQQKQKAYLVDYVNDGNSFALAPSELSHVTLDEVLVTGNSLPPSKNLIDTSDALHLEAEKRGYFDNPDRMIAHNLLSFFEDSLSAGNTLMVEATLDKMAKKWQNKKRTPENRNLLEVYREIIADLSRRYLNLITPEIIIASSHLDSIAISWDTQQMAIITTLEVTEKNLATADIFLEKSKLDMARILLDINDTLLKLKPTTELIAGYESIRSRQEFLKEKYSVFKSNGWMSKEDLFSLIAKRENAEKIILYVQDEKNRLAELAAPVDEEKSLTELIRESFSANKIQIVSMIGADAKDAKVVEIIEARLPDGDIFSGEYLPDFEVIRNIKMDDGREIKNDVKLAQLIPTLESLSVNKYLSSGEDLRTLKTNPIPQLEKDPLEKMDTLDIEVMKLLAQASLSEKKFTVALRDIIITSPKTVKLLGVTFEEIKGHTLEFGLNMETKTIFDAMLFPENMLVSANTLDDLVDASIAAIAKYEENMEIIKQVQWVLINAGIAVGDDEVRFTPSGIHFENGLYHDWKLSGLADSRGTFFLMVMKSGKPFLKNISFDRLKASLEKEWQNEENIRKSIDKS